MVKDSPTLQASSLQKPARLDMARIKRRQLVSSLFYVLCFGATLLALFLLAWLLWGIWRDGSKTVSWDFLNAFPSRFPAKAGIKSAIYGSLWVLGFTFIFAVPIGIGAAIYLEEYAANNRFTRFVQINIANLAGVPSIVYGILGLTLFVRGLHMDRSVLAGGLTLALLVMPIVIISAQEALRAVPSSMRDSSRALGATDWQTIRGVVLPAALPGMLTGVILSLSRAAGETAPLIMIGALTYVAFVPRGPLDGFTTLPIQVFNWTSRPQAAFLNIAASGIIVMLVVLLLSNAVAIWLRYKFSQKV